MIPIESIDLIENKYGDSILATFNNYQSYGTVFEVL